MKAYNGRRNTREGIIQENNSLINRRKFLTSAILAGATVPQLSSPVNGYHTIPEPSYNLWSGHINEGWETGSIIHQSGLNDPIIVSGPLSFNGTNACHCRHRNVSSGSFDMKVEEWSSTYSHYDEKVHSLLFETGHQITEDSDNIYSARVKCDDDHWTNYSFKSGYNPTTYIVLSDVQTHSGNDSVITRNNKFSDSVSVRMQEKDSSSGYHVEEDVGILVIPKDTSSIGGRTCEIGTVTWDGGWKKINFDKNHTDPHFLADIQTMNDSNACSIRYKEKTNSSIKITIDEDGSGSHGNEEIGYAVINNPSLLPNDANHLYNKAHYKITEGATEESYWFFNNTKGVSFLTTPDYSNWHFVSAGMAHSYKESLVQDKSTLEWSLEDRYGINTQRYVRTDIETNDPYVTLDLGETSSNNGVPLTNMSTLTKGEWETWYDNRGNYIGPSDVRKKIKNANWTPTSSYDPVSENKWAQVLSGLLSAFTGGISLAALALPSAPAWVPVAGAAASIAGAALALEGLVLDPVMETTYGDCTSGTFRINDEHLRTYWDFDCQQNALHQNTFRWEVDNSSTADWGTVDVTQETWIDDTYQFDFSLESMNWTIKIPPSGVKDLPRISNFSKTRSNPNTTPF